MVPCPAHTGEGGLGAGRWARFGAHDLTPAPLGSFPLTGQFQGPPSREGPHRREVAELALVKVPSISPPGTWARGEGWSSGLEAPAPRRCCPLPSFKARRRTPGRAGPPRVKRGEAPVPEPRHAAPQPRGASRYSPSPQASDPLAARRARLLPVAAQPLPPPPNAPVPRGAARLAGWRPLSLY